ncbi:DUF3955 domain-containing protein [Haloimpatiens massiliensis]|uniref:DUF3955 domain-containing protein n=1 Tax=Haloimpatiens massiliensis TaxID=1658110 RepID=UPI000C867025|nr:DUF3955 domain-containing protein [Haloimpatiens massiliensis]
MKKYLLSLISFIIAISCIVAYNIIGSKIAPDGTLIEPFFLIPIGWLFIIIGIVSALIIFITSLSRNYKKSSKN